MTDRQTVSEITRTETWDMLLYLEHQLRYYTTLADRYSIRYKAIRYLLLVGILIEGLVVFFLAGQPAWLWGIGGLLAVAIGFLTIFDASTGYAEVTAKLRSLSFDIDILKSEAEHLWRDIESYRIDDEEAERRLESIVTQWTRASQRLSLEVHHHDNVETAKAGYKMVENRYAR